MKVLRHVILYLLKISLTFDLFHQSLKKLRFKRAAPLKRQHPAMDTSEWQFRSSGLQTMFKLKGEMVWTCAEEGQWMYRKIGHYSFIRRTFECRPDSTATNQGSPFGSGLPPSAKRVWWDEFRALSFRKLERSGGERTSEDAAELDFKWF